MFYTTLIAGSVAAFAFEARHDPRAWGAGPGVGVVLIGIVPAVFANLAVVAMLRRRVERLSAVTFIAQQTLLGVACGTAVFPILSIENHVSLIGLFVVPAALSATVILLAARPQRDRI